MFFAIRGHPFSYKVCSVYTKMHVIGDVATSSGKRYVELAANSKTLKCTYNILIKFTYSHHHASLHADMKSSNTVFFSFFFNLLTCLVSTSFFPWGHWRSSPSFTDSPWEGKVTSAFKEISHLICTILHYCHTAHAWDKVQDLPIAAHLAHTPCEVTFSCFKNKGCARFQAKLFYKADKR